MVELKLLSTVVSSEVADFFDLKKLVIGGIVFAICVRLNLLLFLGLSVSFVLSLLLLGFMFSISTAVKLMRSAPKNMTKKELNFLQEHYQNKTQKPYINNQKKLYINYFILKNQIFLFY